MIKKKGWEQRFAEKINKEILACRKENCFSGKDKSWILAGIKDTLYLLGESMNEEYKFANGWRKFCEDMGINIQDNNELGVDTLSKPSVEVPETILGYTIDELKKIINFAKSRDYCLNEKKKS